MSDVLRGSRQRAPPCAPWALSYWDQGLWEQKHLQVFLQPFQNAGTPQAPGTQLQELGGQTVPVKGQNTGWPIASCKSITETPLPSRNNLTSYFVPDLSRLAKAMSRKPLWMSDQSPVGSRSHKPFPPSVGINTMELLDNTTVSAIQQENVCNNIYCDDT